MNLINLSQVAKLCVDFHPVGYYRGIRCYLTSPCEVIYEYNKLHPPLPFLCLISV